MASALNRVTKQFISSGNTPDYPISEWIINPDISSVKDFNRKYWIISGDIVSLMTQEQRDSVDTQQLADFTANEKTEQKTRVDVDRLIVAVVKVFTDEINVIRESAGAGTRTYSYMKTKIKGEINNG